MYRFTKKNLDNIQCVFEEKTGVRVKLPHKSSPVCVRKIVLLAAVLVLSFSMLAFTYPLFSPLAGDQLYLMGQYEGEGIIRIRVINGSDKKLEFQEQLKLMNWNTGEVEALNGKVRFENTAFEPHSSGIMTVDLSQAYPMKEIEQDAAANAYYLLLTNQDFLFGQDWICSFLLDASSEEPSDEREPKSDSIAAQTVSEIEESLRFYFQDHYLDVVPAWNNVNAAYLEKVQEILKEQSGYFVHSVAPLLVLDDLQGYLVTQNHHTMDSFNRIVASMFPGDGQDCALTLGISIPQYEGQADGGVGGFYVRYFFTYPTAEIHQEESYTFIYGRILDFDDMESNQVYEDECYTVYDMTHLFFTDLDTYIDDFLDAFHGDVYMDEQIRQQIHNVYEAYGDKEKISFHYVLDPSA